MVSLRRILPVALLLAIGGLLLPAAAVPAGRLGVGIDRGSLSVDRLLRPGSVALLPAIGVLNTGDEPATYEMDVAPQEGQKALRPDPSWFSFSPASMFLAPGAGRRVGVTLTVPLRAHPGEYLVLVRVSPMVSGGTVSVGIAAASKVSFTVGPASLWQAILVRIGDWLGAVWPWSLLVPLILLSVLVLTLLDRRYRFRVQVSRKKED